MYVLCKVLSLNVHRSYWICQGMRLRHTELGFQGAAGRTSHLQRFMVCMVKHCVKALQLLAVSLVSLVSGDTSGVLCYNETQGEALPELSHFTANAHRHFSLPLFLLCFCTLSMCWQLRCVAQHHSAKCGIMMATLCVAAQVLRPAKCIWCYACLCNSCSWGGGCRHSMYSQCIHTGARQALRGAQELGW